MFDRQLRRMIDPPLNHMGQSLAGRGFTANRITLIGLGLGIFAGLFIAVGWTLFALAPLLASRIADGLDGAVARATRKTDFGGYLDISADFLFYGIIPMAFVWLDPAHNSAAGAFLLTAFYFNGSTFLGYAILAEKKQMLSTEQGVKSLYYSNGILEGAETIGFFVLICLFPQQFPIMAWIFGTLCFATGLLRLNAARLAFTD